MVGVKYSSECPLASACAHLYLLSPLYADSLALLEGYREGLREGPQGYFILE